MKLIPKAKPIRIRISSGGEEHSSLDTLLENFDIEDLLCLYKNGSLARWLNQVGALDIIEKLNNVKIKDFSSITDKEYAVFAEVFFPDIAKTAREIAFNYKLAEDGSRIVRWQKIAYNAGNMESAYELGRIYSQGLFGISQSIRDALNFYEIAANGGITEAIKDIVQLYSDGKIGIDYLSCSKIRKLLTNTANNDPEVAYLLADIYFHLDAKGFKELGLNNANAIKYLTIAANAKYKKAYFLLGILYSTLGKHEKAIKWLEMAKQEPDILNTNTQIELYCTLGHSYLEISPNGMNAYLNYKEAACLGSNFAKNKLGRMYEYGLGGLEQDYIKSMWWYKHAAKADDADGQYNVGRCYAEGIGVQIDLQVACEWLRSAVKQGHLAAKVKLAVCYNELDIRHSETLQLITEAANANDSNAQYLMGNICEMGKFNIRKNIQRAIEWYKKAADNGDYDAVNKLVELDVL